MTRSLSPLTEKTITSRFSAWIDIIKRKESGSILNLSNREQLWRIDQFLRHAIVRTLTHTQILPINLASLSIEEAEEFETYLSKKIDPKNKSIVLLILGADRLLDEKQYLLSSLNSLPHRNTNCSILFFFQKNITLPHYLKKLSHFPTLYQNIVLYPLYEKKDIQQFIIYLQEKFGSTLPITVQNTIIEQCGGSLWLVKESVRHYLKTADAFSTLNHEESNMRLEICLNEFDELEKKVLEKIVEQKKYFSKEENIAINYLTKTNWLVSKNNKYTITVPLLGKYIQKQLIQKNKLDLNENHEITMNGVIINHFFSRREKLALLHFLKDSNHIVTREQFASIVWGKNYSEMYTDWALDQFVKRLRGKIFKLGLDPKQIKTVKNQGFIFQKAYDNNSTT